MGAVFWQSKGNEARAPDVKTPRALFFPGGTMIK
jgi:hypothetical protein